MEKFVITGRKPIHGRVKLAGAKNSIGKLLIASLLTEAPVRLENVPQSGETDIAVELCRHIGSRIRRSGHNLEIITPGIVNPRVKELSRKNRIPILALGPLLVRAGRGEVPTLGGDRIGPRPVDFHLAALKRLGAVTETSAEAIRARAPDGLCGSNITLPYPSVGATETSILATVRARGMTVIENAATEPEILDMIKILKSMGANIKLGPERTIHIQGVPELHGTAHRLIPDRIEAASFGVLALASGGEILVEEAVADHLLSFLKSVERTGGGYEAGPEGIRFFRRGALEPIHIETDTHPGFMTDWQQPFSVLLTQAEGESIVHETVYEDRFGYTQDLRRMGADVTLSPRCLGRRPCRFKGQSRAHSAIIHGPTPLNGTHLTMPDIRAGMAHLIAALIAEGRSEISGVEHIDRGYERIDERIRALGADIQRVAG